MQINNLVYNGGTMLNNNISKVLTLILMCILSTLSAKTISTTPSYFTGTDSDKVNEQAITFAARSFETKVYTLDMLYQSQKTCHIYDGLSIEYYLKDASKNIEPGSKNKYDLIIDIGKKKYSALEIYNDKAYMEYFRKVQRDDIHSYLVKLNANNEMNIPLFINESSVYFNIPEFECAYADFLVDTLKNQRLNEIINYYLLGGDFTKAALYIDQASVYNSRQTIHVFMKAEIYDKAISLLLKSGEIDYGYLANICAPIYTDEKLNSDTKEIVFSQIPETNASQLLDYYSGQKQFLIGYLFAIYRFKADNALLSV